MPLNTLLSQHPLLLDVAVALLSLIVGSFLNVLILRLPTLMEFHWRRDAREFLQLEADDTSEPPTLWRPASHCPHCRTPIAPWHNIPLLSFVLLRGRCAACAQPISWQYPLVELGAALLALVCLWRFGTTAALPAALLLSWALLALAVIDARTQLLPDDLTLPLLWLGLLAALIPIFAPLSSAVVGAALGYLSLWSVYWLFKLVTGKEGMGYGDFKLLAALGAWLGWQALPLIILLASISAALVGIALLLFAGRDRQATIPFGPYLAVAGWLVMIAGPWLPSLYGAATGPTP